MHDLVIRAGCVVDGTGGPRRTCDIAIRDGIIAEMGSGCGPARVELDADGALVTPGFIDIHTHYDGQFIWDDRLDPSFSHGVTTAIGGNCGVGFAPVNAHRTQLMQLMEGVEDIPGIVLDEGLDWSWSSFPEYLDRLASRSYAMDIGCNLTHAPIRVFVMGERALRHEAATAADIEQMAAIVREGMATGALGFSNGRITTHASSRGDPVPGTYAEEDELLALAQAMGSSGHGVFQLIPRGANGAAVTQPLSRSQRLAEHDLIERIASAAGRPLTYTLLEYAADLGDLQAMASASRESSRRGISVRPQISARGLGAIQTLDGYHVFLRRPSYRMIAHLPRAERAARMRDPQLRRQILREPDVDGEFADNPAVLRMLRGQMDRLPGTFVLADASDYEPAPDRTVGALAAAAGKTPAEFIYDHYASGDGSNYNVTFILNYARGSLDHVHDLMIDDNVVNGLADGGAHVKITCDASMPTFGIAFWTRDRKRGARLSLERMVKRMTADCADLYGMHDRGALAVGKRADINVIDYDRLTLKPPRIVNDLPSGAARLQQDSSGYIATLVNGVITRRNDTDTGERPGRLVRGGAIH